MTVHRLKARKRGQISRTASLLHYSLLPALESFWTLTLVDPEAGPPTQVGVSHNFLGNRKFLVLGDRQGGQEAAGWCEMTGREGTAGPANLTLKLPFTLRHSSFQEVFGHIPFWSQRGHGRAQSPRGPTCLRKKLQSLPTPSRVLNPKGAHNALLPAKNPKTQETAGTKIPCRRLGSRGKLILSSIFHRKSRTRGNSPYPQNLPKL